MKSLIIVLVLLALFQISFQKKPPTLPREVIEFMGSRHMRYHHFLWHNLRELWPEIDEKTQQAIADLGWAPPRPSLIYEADGSYTPDENNYSGEDFLYMHHQMILEVNKILEKVGGPYKKVTGWKKFPKPTDKNYPVPANYVIPGEENESFTQMINDIKSDEFYRNEIVKAERHLKCPLRLRRMTLGQLGSKLEYTVHQWMHLRFSEMTPIGVRVSTWEPAPNIDTKWDDLEYQWLADTYSSHVNPVFWKIHGWVEDRLEDWRKANMLDNIPWKHTWAGGPMENLGDMFEATGSGRLLMDGHDTMEEVARLMLNSVGGQESTIYRCVNDLNSRKLRKMKKAKKL